MNAMQIVQALSSPALAPMAYRLPEVNTYDDWKGHQREDFAPTQRQSVIVAAMRIALAEGLYYTADVVPRMAELLSVPDGLRDVQRSEHTRVENGEFGMDCYYARRYLDAQEKHAKERAAAVSMALRVGDNLGILVFSDGKRTTGCTVEELHDGDRSVTFTGKRGTVTVRSTATPLQLRNAMERAHTYGKRKGSVADFCAARPAFPTLTHLCEIAARFKD